MTGDGQKFTQHHAGIYFIFNDKYSRQQPPPSNRQLIIVSYRVGFQQ
jgi:hypothetical protein